MNKLFAYAMRGLGLSWLWVLGRTSDADNRCPTLLFITKPNEHFFVNLKKDYL